MVDIDKSTHLVAFGIMENEPLFQIEMKVDIKILIKVTLTNPSTIDSPITIVTGNVRINAVVNNTSKK